MTKFLATCFEGTTHAIDSLISVYTLAQETLFRFLPHPIRLIFTKALGILRLYLCLIFTKVLGILRPYLRLIFIKALGILRLYLRHVRDQLRRSSYHTSTESGWLIDALACQIELESGNVLAILAEMADLFHEIFTLDTPNEYITMSFALFLVALLSYLKVTFTEVLDPDQPVDRFIECLRAARGRQLLQEEVRVALALFIYMRYIRTSADADYEEAVSLLDEVIASSSADNVFAGPAQQLVTVLAMRRSMLHSIPEYSEEATYRIREFIRSPFVKESLDCGLLFDLKGAATQRFLHFPTGGDDAESIKEDIRQLSASQLQLRMTGVSLIKDDDSEVSQLYKSADLLMPLVIEIIDDDGSRVDEAIEKGRTIVLASPSPKNQFTPFPSLVFGEMLFQAFFVHPNKTEYLHEFIDTRRQILHSRLTLPPAWRFRILHQLSLTLVIRSKMPSRLLPDRSMQDIDEAMELLSQCVDDEYGRLPDRCWFACRWAYIARDNRHPTVSTAYERAMSLMPDTLLFAPTLQLQHHTLATSDDFHKMSLDYASYRVDLGQPKEAIETLERGRALLWSEMRYLRVSIDQLPQAGLQLGEKFVAVNRDLEELTKSIPPRLDLVTDDDGAADNLRGVGPFGHLLVKQRKLLKEREKLISQIRVLPDFDNFLTSPSFDTLRSAASSGPIIIINHSIWRCDILIILHDSLPSLIPTSDDFFVRAKTLKNELLYARNKHGPGSYQYNKTLAQVLADLYDLVGKPVIHRLRQLNVPEQSRVWWCPTSVFCSLPLHAMGPIPSDDGGEDRYFLDLYIPSYTPTLSALIPASERREPGSPTLALPSLLLVAHFDVPSPDESLSEVCKDIEVVQALEKRLSVKSLISEDTTPSSVLDGLRDHQFVHFVCHGMLEAGKPFDAGFELHGNKRLTLLEIVRSRLPAAEFAFLSACHTAELTEGSSADEGLHLAAAVQYCGFRSVVGTMWAMANDDGKDVAKYFYRSMFARRGMGTGELVPYYKRSAGALRGAVQRLRRNLKKSRIDPGIVLERWVNFVHYGS